MKLIIENLVNYSTGEVEKKTLYFQKHLNALEWLIDHNFRTYNKSELVDVYYREVNDNLRDFAFLYKNG